MVRTNSAAVGFGRFKGGIFEERKMMTVIILWLLLAIFFAWQRSKLIPLTVAHFPDVSPDVFAQWYALQFKSINLLFLTSVVLLFVDLILSLWVVMVARNSSQGIIIGVIQCLFLTAFCIVLVMSAIAGSKAAGLKKKYGIRKR